MMQTFILPPRSLQMRARCPRRGRNERLGTALWRSYRSFLRTLVDDALRFAKRTFDSTLLHDLHNGGNADEILDSIGERRACLVAVGMPDTGRPLDVHRQ